MPAFRPHVPPPPSSVTGPLAVWFREVERALNALPTFSFFSGDSPGASNISGQAGDVAFNFGSASTDSRMFIHGGTGTSYDTTNWFVVRIATP